MANDQLILQINKLNSSVDNRRLKYNQAERGRAIDVTVIDNDGSTAYDLTGKTIIFTDDKIENKIIVDSSDSLGDQSGKFVRTSENDKLGKFTYVFTDYAMQQSGEACFEFVTDSKHIDVSSSFFIDIQATGTLAPENTSYVSDMEAFKAHYNAIINNADAQIKSVTDRLSNALDSAIASGNATLQEKIKSYSDQFDQYLKDFDAAKAKNLEDLQNLKDKIAETETDAVSKIVDGTNQQIQQANDKLNAKLSDLQDDYDTWKVQTVKDFNATVDPIKQSIGANSQNLDKVTQSVKDTIAQMQNLQTEFNKVDFTKFAKLSDLAGYYTKDQIDDLVKTAGKVKTVNGIEPDTNGNITVQAGVASVNGETGALTGFAKLSDIKVTSVNGKTGDVTVEAGVTSVNGQTGAITGLAKTSDIKVSSVNGQTGDVKIDVGVTSLNGKTGALTGFATSSDVTDATSSVRSNLEGSIGTVSKQVTDVINRVTKLEQKKPIKASSKDDAIAKSKLTNDIYYY